MLPAPTSAAAVRARPRCGRLREAGIRCVIAPSFGDIFHDNAYQNGLLPLETGHRVDRASGECLQASNASELTVDLLRCELLVAGHDPVPFVLGEMFAARQGLGYLLMTAIGLHDVTLIMSLTFVLTALAVCASAALLTVDRRLRRRF